MVRDRLFSAHLRDARFQFIDHCELLEERLLLSGDALVDASPTRIAAEWGVAAIHAPEVWTEGYTGRAVTVAVVDTGVALAHPDLADRLWTNTGEVPGNGRDDDENGFIDDVQGWDFLDMDNQPDDPTGHGTHITGIIAAGVVPPDPSEIAVSSIVDGVGESLGVAPGASVMPIRVLDGNLRGANQDIAAGIRYAVDNGAEIINLSIGGAENAAIRSAIEYAEQQDVLVVVAAGNNRASEPSYPASASRALDNVLSAGAFRENGQREPSSNLVGASGAVQVDAPGQGIRSTFVAAKYGYQSGTSMAAPHVAGLAALLLSANPRLSARELRAMIVDSADPAAIGSDSAGRVNAMSALTLALQSTSEASEQPINQESIAVAPPARAASLQGALPAQITPRLESRLANAPFAAAKAFEPAAISPASFSSRTGVFILPQSVSDRIELTNASMSVRQLESDRHLHAQNAGHEAARSLRDAALLAYRVETGGSAMSWPLDDTDNLAHTKSSKQHKLLPRASAAAAAPQLRR